MNRAGAFQDGLQDFRLEISAKQPPCKVEISRNELKSEGLVSFQQSIQLFCWDMTVNVH